MVREGIKFAFFVWVSCRACKMCIFYGKVYKKKGLQRSFLIIMMQLFLLDQLFSPAKKEIKK